MKYTPTEMASWLSISSQLMRYYIAKFDREGTLPRSKWYSTEGAVKLMLVLSTYFTAQGKDRQSERARCAAAKLSEQLTTVES